MRREGDPRGERGPMPRATSRREGAPRRILRSFTHAGRGFRWALASQPNLRVHLLIGAAVLAAAILFHFSTLEFAALFLCFAIVLGAELFNTALEILTDLAWPEPNPLVGRAKDVAAAAVLVAAAGAALAGLLLFGRHFLIKF